MSEGMRASRHRYRADSWQPGDPIYVHPQRDYNNDWAHVVRAAFEVKHDEAGAQWNNMTYESDYCPRCEVSWDGDGDLRCWNCGKPGLRARFVTDAPAPAKIRW